MQEHAHSLQGIRKRRIHVVNLDPAAEQFSYECLADVRDLISVTDVMQELGLGPNGALVYCMEYLLQHVSDWLCHDILSDLDEDDTVLLDCPGQVELVTHVPILKSLVEQLQDWQGHVVTVYCLDVTFVLGDVTKFWSGSLLALAAMIALEVPHVNLLTKTDLLSPRQRDELDDTLLAQSPQHVLQNHEYHATSTVAPLLSLPPRSHRMGHGEKEEEEDSNEQADDNNDDDNEDPPMRRSFANLDYPLAEPTTTRRHNNKWHGLTQALGQVLEDYSMVSFLPLNITDEDSVDHVLATVDHAIQHGESADVRGADLQDDHDFDEGGDES